MAVKFFDDEDDIVYDVDDMEIYGHLESYNTGREIAHRFVPDWFSDTRASDYFDANYEEIEEEILTAFSNE